MRIFFLDGIEWDLSDFTEEEKAGIDLPKRLRIPEGCVGDETVEDYLLDEYGFYVIGIRSCLLMSIDCFAIHIYGVKIDRYLHLRPEFDFLPNNDIYEVKDYVDTKRFDELPDEYPGHARDISYFYTEDGMYIGYSAIMPYEMPRHTKEHMDKNIHDLLVYLYGEEAAVTMTPDEIHEAWFD